MRARVSSEMRWPVRSRMKSFVRCSGSSRPSTSSSRSTGRIRDHILEGAPLDVDGVELLAELDARAEAEGIDVATGEELLWRLRERQLRRELQGADVARTRELQEMLGKLLERVSALSGR